MSMQIHFFPQHTIQQYYLNSKAKNGKLYLEIIKAMYKLPQAGSLANKQLQKYLSPARYLEWAHTPGLWQHISRQTTFTFIVGDLGFKYCQKEDAQHLIDYVLVNYDKVTEHCKGKLYCGIFLNRHYEEGWVDTSPCHVNMKMIHKK